MKQKGLTSKESRDWGYHQFLGPALEQEILNYVKYFKQPIYFFLILVALSSSHENKQRDEAKSFDYVTHMYIYPVFNHPSSLQASLQALKHTLLWNLGSPSLEHAGE